MDLNYIINAFCKFAEEPFLLESTKKELLKTIKQKEEPFELTLVPNVVKHFSHGDKEVADKVKKDLLTLSRLGLIELRPESGLGRLSKEEKENTLYLGWTRCYCLGLELFPSKHPSDNKNNKTQNCFNN